MNESELNNKVFQKLQEFESTENIHPSADWNQSLMKRLANISPNSTSIFSGSKFVVLTFFIIILINISLVLSAVINNSSRTYQKNNELEIISKEFLINPTSLNN